MRSLKSYFLILFFLLEILGGCAPDAPHENPIDPGSQNYKADGALTGTVLSLGLPYLGIPNALVTIEQSGSAQYTATGGSFDFADAPAGNITLVITKALYMNDTVEINLPAGGKLDTVIHMDALPQISNAQVVTSKIDQWLPGPVYSALVTAVVVDPDGLGDIDSGSVFVKVDSLTFKMHSPDARNWQVTISSTQLPNQDIQWLVGRQLVVTATDHEHGTGQSAGFYVTRVIEAEALPTSPTNSDTTTNHPQFSWDPPLYLFFGYNYQLQIYQVNSGIQTPIGPPISISGDSVSYNYGGSLAIGQYSWTITVVDDFGNSSTSKEASFQVQ